MTPPQQQPAHSHLTLQGPQLVAALAALREPAATAATLAAAAA